MAGIIQIPDLCSEAAHCIRIIQLFLRVETYALAKIIQGLVDCTDYIGTRPITCADLNLISHSRPDLIRHRMGNCYFVCSGRRFSTNVGVVVCGDVADSLKRKRGHGLIAMADVHADGDFLKNLCRDFLLLKMILDGVQFFI